MTRYDAVVIGGGMAGARRWPSNWASRAARSR
jgi:pyruvate/2-oxoglutarate dehydrogenase complex dihydrolipoamide dehydrogenase (E3) component